MVYQRETNLPKSSIRQLSEHLANDHEFYKVPLTIILYFFFSVLLKYLNKSVFMNISLNFKTCNTFNFLR